VSRSKVKAVEMVYKFGENIVKSFYEYIPKHISFKYSEISNIAHNKSYHMKVSFNRRETIASRNDLFAGHTACWPRVADPWIVAS
jgi:hypothetical protein